MALAASLAFQYLNRAQVMHVSLAVAYALLFVAVPYALARHFANRRPSASPST